MKGQTKTLILLHTAVFLAGWTGIFGRLISLGGLPLVWYRIMVSVAVLAIVLAIMGRLLLGSVFTILPFLFQLQALRSLSAFTVNLAYNLEPVYSIALAAILFGELQEVNFSFWLGIALIVISVLIQTRRVSRNDMIS